MQFPYVHICAILSNDRINDAAVKTFIAEEAQERDVVDPGGLKEAAAFKGIRLLGFFYFSSGKLPGPGIGMDNLEGFPGKRTIREHDRHPC